MSTDRVRIAIDGHLATVTLSRPEKHNALDFEMFDAIIAAAETVRGTPGIRAIVLHGEGKSFCSGLDLASLMMAQAADGEAITKQLLGRCRTSSSASRSTG